MAIASTFAPKSCPWKNSAAAPCCRPQLNPHGHDDVSVAVLIVGEGAHLAGGLLVLEFNTDRPFGRRAQKIEQVLRVEADRERVAFVFLVDGFLGLAILGAGSGNLHAVGATANFTTG